MHPYAYPRCWRLRTFSYTSAEAIVTGAEGPLGLKGLSMWPRLGGPRCWTTAASIQNATWRLAAAAGATWRLAAIHRLALRHPVKVLFEMHPESARHRTLRMCMLHLISQTQPLHTRSLPHPPLGMFSGGKPHVLLCLPVMRMFEEPFTKVRSVMDRPGGFCRGK